jgi:hypothetical protein
MTDTHQKRHSSLLIMQKCLVLASAVIVTLNTTWVNISQQGLNKSVEPHQLNSKHNVLKHSLLQHDGKRVQGHYKLKSKNIMIPLGYNAIEMHKNILLS